MSPRPALSLALDAFVEARRSAEAAARAELRLNETEVRALRRIRDRPGIRPSELREHLGVTSAGVTTLVDRLVERDLLRRELDTEDRRANHIYLEIDLEAVPWSELDRFARDVDRAVDAETAATTDGFADALQRIIRATLTPR
ncbi:MULTISPECIES: MarR family winged helix-turn-helix transcriptional regulator [Microbacterium]|jgi:predicted transcriptional regulator|uniref:MarR family winged helix-turn-helix transcriptional regulator n=1 Tax=Microbacterium TaxID=33882 RepID=UPI001D178553|nr:MarR family transcriptional regulator [Microbacterium testaceum]MCC4250035.1 MarR family transcriptional regulator [Microbacterium testaceum]